MISDLTERVVRRYVEAVYRPRGPAKMWERIHENDDFTKQNIPEEYHLLWERVKRQFKGTPHSRYEQFMEWMEENPDVNTFVLIEHAEKAQRKLERQEKMEALCQERCPSCYNRPTGYDLEDLPF